MRIFGYTCKCFGAIFDPHRQLLVVAYDVTLLLNAICSAVVILHSGYLSKKRGHVSVR